MTLKEAKSLVQKIKYASFSEAVKIVKELEIKKAIRMAESKPINGGEPVNR